MANHGPVDLQFHTERQPYRHNWDARKNRMVHVQDPKVVESPRRPLTIQRGEIRRTTCASVGAYVHVGASFLKESRA